MSSLLGAFDSVKHCCIDTPSLSWSAWERGLRLIVKLVVAAQ